jgi:hypothetical protein
MWGPSSVTLQKIYSYDSYPLVELEDMFTPLGDTTLKTHDNYNKEIKELKVFHFCLRF